MCARNALRSYGVVASIFYTWFQQFTNKVWTQWNWNHTHTQCECECMSHCWFTMPSNGALQRTNTKTESKKINKMLSLYLTMQPSHWTYLQFLAATIWCDFVHTGNKNQNYRKFAKRKLKLYQTWEKKKIHQNTEVFRYIFIQFILHNICSECWTR